MYFVYFDSGTSNTRGYLISHSKDVDVVDVRECAVGSKDSSISGSNQVLMTALKELYDSLLVRNGISDESVQRIYASGMVTSPFGIKEVPHITTPVSLKRIHAQIYRHYEKMYFEREIYLIPGVKTISDDFAINMENVCNVNNMRGEETEVFGILPELKSAFSRSGVAIVFPGSHTQIVYVKQGEIKDILSTFSGELYHAISTRTILSGSVNCDNEVLDEEMVMWGFRNLKDFGISRALYIAHATKIFDVCSNQQRMSYLEGVISGSVVQAFEQTAYKNWTDLEYVLIAASNPRVARVYERILNEDLRGIKVSTITASAGQSFAVKGFCALLKYEIGQ